MKLQLIFIRQVAGLLALVVSLSQGVGLCFYIPDFQPYSFFLHFLILLFLILLFLIRHFHSRFIIQK